MDQHKIGIRLTSEFIDASQQEEEKQLTSRVTEKSELVSIRDGNLSEEIGDNKSELVDRFGATQQVSYLDPQLLENHNGALDAVTQNTIEVNKRDSI